MQKNYENVDLVKNQSNTSIELAWLNSEQAAVYLGVSVETLRNLVCNGQIPYYKFGRRNRYILSELDQLLRSKPMGERFEHKRK